MAVSRHSGLEQSSIIHITYHSQGKLFSYIEYATGYRRYSVIVRLLSQTYLRQSAFLRFAVNQSPSY